MLTKTLSFIASGMLLVASAAGVWSQYSTVQVNRLVEEANNHSEQGAKIDNDARAKFNVFYEAIQAFPTNRAELEHQGRELSETYARSAAEYGLAAEKGAEAAAKSTDAAQKVYYQTKSSHWQKGAEIRTLFSKYTLLVTEPSVRTMDELRARRVEFDASTITLKREADALKEKADKIYSENRAKFE